MYDFHYDYMRLKYRSKFDLCYMDTDSFVHEIKTHEFYRDIVKDLEKRFVTRGHSKDDNRLLPIVKNKKVTGLMKDDRVCCLEGENVCL